MADETTGCIAKYYRMKQGKAFERGFFSVFGLTTCIFADALETIRHRSDNDALRGDAEAIATDIRRVFSKEAGLVDEQQK